MKDRARRGEAGQVTEASLIATQKEGTGLFPKNGHAGLFFESDLCSCPSSLCQRLDKSRTSCSCYGRKRIKCAVSLGRSLPAGQSEELAPEAGLQGVCSEPFCTCTYKPGRLRSRVLINRSKTQQLPTSPTTVMNLIKMLPSTFPLKVFSFFFPTFHLPFITTPRTNSLTEKRKNPNQKCGESG